MKDVLELIPTENSDLQVDIHFLASYFALWSTSSSITIMRATSLPCFAAILGLHKGPVPSGAESSELL